MVRIGPALPFPAEQDSLAASPRVCRRASGCLRFGSPEQSAGVTTNLKQTYVAFGDNPPTLEVMEPAKRLQKGYFSPQEIF